MNNWLRAVLSAVTGGVSAVQLAVVSDAPGWAAWAVAIIVAQVAYWGRDT